MALHYENWSKAGHDTKLLKLNPRKLCKNFNWVQIWIDEYFFLNFLTFFLV